MKKCTAWLLITILLAELVAPLPLSALTSGPTQPEATSFEPIGTTGMVNEFTGGFTYNLPLLDVPGPNGSGYPVSIAYHSNANPEDDATWVGFGWTINPGAISRSLRGIPDDYNGDVIEHINKVEPSRTYAIGSNLKLELFSFLGPGVSSTARWNSSTGYSVVSGFELDVSNMLTLRATVRNGVTKFSADVNFSAMVQQYLASRLKDIINDITEQQNAAAGGAILAFSQGQMSREEVNEAISNAICESSSAQDAARAEHSRMSTIASIASSFVAGAMATASSPAHTSKYSSTSYQITFGITIDPIPSWGITGLQAGIEGSYSSVATEPLDVVSSYGYLYEGNSSENDGRDYGLDRVTSYTTRDRYLSGVSNNYDVFSCNAQGLGGSMRLHQRKLAVHGPRSMTSNTKNLTIGFDATVGAKVAVGATVGAGVSFSTIKPASTVLAGSYKRERIDPYQNNGRAVMRFMGDPSTSIALSSEDIPEAIGINALGLTSSLPTFVHERLNDQNDNVDTLYRPRQAASITYRTNAEIIGRTNTAGDRLFAYTSRLSPNERHLDRAEKAIASGIGEVAVAAATGVNYVFGLPVYSRNEETFSYTRELGDGNLQTRLGNVVGHGKRLGTSNGNGMRRERPYASTFLLTEVRTPDYIDRSMDGPTADDFGGYTLFTYDRAYGSYKKWDEVVGDDPNVKPKSPLNDWYRWRIPYRGFTFEPGSISEPLDDRASASMGFREQYYLATIETKSHTAFFITNMTDTTITIGGQSVRLKGSGTMRNDAFQAFNYVKGYTPGTSAAPGSKEWHRLNEHMSADYLSPLAVPTYLDRDSSEPYVGRTIGGRRLETRFEITQGVIDEGSASWRENKMRFLEKIVLVAKEPDGENFSQIIKTVNLEYDYSLGSYRYNPGWEQKTYWTPNDPEAPLDPWDTVYVMGGELNSAVYLSEQGLQGNHNNMNRITGCNYGKLTLRRIWTDYGDVHEARIAPYRFDYAYPYDPAHGLDASITTHPSWNGIKDYDEAHKLKKDGVDSPLLTDLAQNPRYLADDIDAWGSYRRDGWSKAGRMVRHVDQSTWGVVTDETRDRFDPAVWQLKRIMLPSGGEIRVQYEANTYSYVQDKRVEAFVPLKTGVTQNISGNEVRLDLSVLPGRNARDIVKLMEAKRKSQRMDAAFYFKFLMPFGPMTYDVDGNIAPDYGMEYITGYSLLANIPLVDTVNVNIKFESNIKPTDVFSEFLFNRNGHRLHAKNGKTRIDSKDNPEWIYVWSEKNKKYQWERTKIKDHDLWKRLLADAPVVNEIASSRATAVRTSNTIIKKLSYVRIPCVWKYGGGVRVKRIIMLDPGIEGGRAALYGSEYHYDMVEDGMVISSGVATNEPAAIREESALTELMVGRNEKGFFENLSSGEDLDQVEGPRAAAALPSASIGYRRVVVEPLAVSATSPGYTVAEFYTAKDYPMRDASTDLDQSRFVIPPLPVPYVSVQIARYVASQGHAIIHNAMHGKPRATSMCRGDYQLGRPDAVVERHETEYFEPGAPIPVLRPNGEGGLRIDHEVMGREVDVAVETRRLLDYKISARARFDLGFTFPFLFFAHGCPPQGALSEQDFAFAVVTKIISYGAFERRKVVIKDGMRHVIENIAFDEATGTPVVTSMRSDQHGNNQSGIVNDGHQSFSIPAWTQYTAMDWKGYNEGMMVKGSINGLVFTPNPASASSSFTVGDLVTALLDDNSTPDPADDEHLWAHVASVSSSMVTLVLASESAAAPSSATAVDLIVVRSGRTNQLTAQTATIIRHSTARLSAGTLNLGSSNIISAEATTYASHWPVAGASYHARQVNDFEKGVSGKWRPSSAYVFRSATRSFPSNGLGIAGSTANAVFAMFNYANPSASETAGWVRTTTIAVYNHHGEAVMQLDALNIPSMAAFAHHDAVPSIVARNAEVSTAAFESFEDNTSATNAAAHTGHKSLLLQTTDQRVARLLTTARLAGSGLLMCAWCNAAGNAPVAKVGGNTVTSRTLIATVAGWKLYQWKATSADVAGWSWNTTTPSLVDVDMSVASSSPSTYVDDVRIQPLDAEASCYVYDVATLRLLAQFDDQHFAVIYKYDTQGRLRRKERETERGIVPLQEHAMNTPKQLYAERADAPFGPQALRAPAQNGGYPNAAPQALRRGLDKIPMPSGVQGKADVLEIRLTPDKQRWRLFDNPSEDIPPLDSIVKALPKANTNDNTKSNTKNGNTTPEGKR